MLVGPYETATAHVCWDGKPPRWDYESELERARARPPHALAGEGHRAPAAVRPGRPQVGHLRRHHPHAGRRLSLRPGATARRTTGCIAAPRSASARAAAPANISRNGWCMARPRSTCASSIRAASATGRRKDYTAEVSIADYHHMYYCYKPAEQHRGRPRPAQVVALRHAEGRGRAVRADLRLGAAALVRQERQGRGLFLQALQLVGGGARRKHWPCASASASWISRPSRSST